MREVILGKKICVCACVRVCVCVCCMVQASVAESQIPELW